MQGGHFFQIQATWGWIKQCFRNAPILKLAADPTQVSYGLHLQFSSISLISSILSTGTATLQTPWLSFGNRHMISERPMPIESSRREPRSVLVPLDRYAILDELERILASPHFCNSKRYPALLRYIVESTLAGKSESLKERTLGIEIFGRPADYDTNSDTIVRYTAGEVRKRLLLYYSEDGHSSAIRISLAPGSYVPDFHEVTRKKNDDASAASPAYSNQHEAVPVAADSAAQPAHWPTDGETHDSAATSNASARSRPWARLLALFLVAACLLAAALVAWNWKHSPTPGQRALSEFWTPVVSAQQQVLICTGGVVFNQGTYSGTLTANRDVEYPFISLQNAAAIARVSGQLEHFGMAAQLIPSPSTPLTDLREHSIVLIGAYNNQWTMRLLAPLRYHFSPVPTQSILDTRRPQFHLERNESLPYSSADDYAIVARYRDPVTDSWVVVLAGIGRNGTEAAADFATSSNHLQLLRNRLGGSLANKNVEVVLKVNVIDGKTGAPWILDAYSW
jgi:hypothetical protein